MKYTRSFLLTLALLGAVCFFPAPAQAAWIDTDWLYRNPVRIDATHVVNTDQTDFPILISHTDLDWRDVANGGQVGQTDGGDILFTAADGTTQLDHEIEAYDPTTGKLIAWIRVPALSATVDTDLYIYYGNAAAPDQANPTEVWDDNFAAVYHLDEDPSGPGPQIKDRTTSANHGTTEGTMLPAASVSAQIGRGLQFDGVDDLIRVLDSTSLDGTADAATFEVWIRWTNSADGDHQDVMVSSNRFDPTTPDGFEWATQGDGDHFFYPRGYVHENHNLGPNPFTNGIFQHVWLTLEYATREVKIYVDGTAMTFTYVGAPANWNQEAAPQDWLWGGHPAKPTRHLDGVLDEIRVSDVIRSEDWLQTSFNNQSSPATFHAVQVQEGAPIHAITGTVFEDIDYTGMASDWDGGISDVPQPNADVELYDSPSTYLASTTTDAAGIFTFTGLTDGTYEVRVRSATLGDPDTPTAGGFNATVPGTWPYPLAEMTWGHNAALIGGQDPGVDDTATGDNAGPGDTYVTVTVSGGDVSGVNFGFNYELIVNEDDDTNSDSLRSKQGTLRQFIKNSNAIAGVNKSWFQIP